MATGNEPTQYDLVIVGASFAGLACARSAALRGLKVCVIEAKSDAGARVHTTGILVKEAADELDVPSHLTRAVYGIRLYSPSLKCIDLFSPGYYFLTSDTRALLRWMQAEAARAGAHMLNKTRLTSAHRVGGAIILPHVNIRCRYLVGADGAKSTVARLFGLGRNSRFLLGMEAEYSHLAGLDKRFLHCFLDSRRAPGYLAWIAPAPNYVQVGLATSDNRKPNLGGFRNHTSALFNYSASQIVERRAGVIPCGGIVRPFTAGNVLLIGDAAGMVSPLTGGGIQLALRHGRRAGQLIADYLLHWGPDPAVLLKKEIGSLGAKRVLRRMMDIGLPNRVIDTLISTPLMRKAATHIYFHRRAPVGETPQQFARKLQEHDSTTQTAGRRSA